MGGLVVLFGVVGDGCDWCAVDGGVVSVIVVAVEPSVKAVGALLV